MSRMGDWVIEMQEDCIYMDRGPWIEKYGTRFAYIYDEQLRVVAPVDQIRRLRNVCVDCVDLCVGRVYTRSSL
jgi:hypothetical protein